MFRPRNPRPFLIKLRETLWPSRGWLRASRYIGHRLGRLPGTPYRIAAGFACGAAVSFTPFVGLHFVLAAGLSLLLRGHVVASAIGTAVGNPWTFPLIWTWIFWLGRTLLGESGGESLPNSLTLSYIFDNFWTVLWPMTLGGTLTAPFVWMAVYFPLRMVVAQYQHARHRRLRKRVIKRRAKSAGMPPRKGLGAEGEAG